MFQMSCNENTDCEILSAMNCESCLKSDAVTYCPLHNKLLCYYCDIKIHLPEPVPPLLELEIEVKAMKKTDRRKKSRKRSQSSEVKIWLDPSEVACNTSIQTLS
ncbi:hypothetical protein YC2023_011275 [Brassica napus]